MSQISLDFGMAVASDHDADGHPQVAIDLPGGTDEGGSGGAAPAEVLSVFGMLSRPLDPERDPNGQISIGCGLLWLRNGDERHAFLLEDPRVIALLPKLKKGGSMMYCADGSFIVFDGLDPTGAKRAGSMTASVKYESASGGEKAHVIALDKRTQGKEQASFLHGEGMGLMMNAGGKRSAILRNADGKAWLETNDSGNVIAGTTKVQGSMTVGDQATTEPVAIAPNVAAALNTLTQAVVGIAAAASAALGAQAAGPIGAALAGQMGPLVAKLGAQHLKAT